MKTSPVFSVRRNDGALFWFDLEWGQGWGAGAGGIGRGQHGPRRENLPTKPRNEDQTSSL
jgi:hypothetical protein